MRRSITKDNQKLQIIYSESFNHDFYSEISSQFKEATCLFFVSTLPFYEAYYEKLVNLLEKGKSFQWFICPNNQSINSIKSYQKIVAFIDETNMPINTTIVCAGNQSIYHLCAFLKQTSPYIDKFIFFSTTIKGFSKAILGQAYLCGEIPFCPIVKEYAIPNYLIYSQPLNYLEDKISWEEDFHSLMVLGLSKDEEVFKLLNEMLPREHGASLAPYLGEIIETQKANKFDSELTISAFLKGFYHLSESHYLTKNQKEYIAFLLYFLWSIQKNNINFDFKPFILWYENILRVELTLPKQMNTYDLAESIANELNRFAHVTGIQSIGKSAPMQRPSLDELFQVIVTYRKIKEE